MALVFPPSPAVGQRFTANPGTTGQTQYRWDGTKWDAVLSTVSLGVANQDAFNTYQWPDTDGVAGRQLTTNGAGQLSWALPAAPTLTVLGVQEAIDGVRLAYTLVLVGTATPFTPNPSTNIVVFLGGVPQIPVASYTVAGATITFDEAPLVGSTFYAISNTLVP